MQVVGQQTTPQNIKIFAAIAQSVERILGKDEVASSNLASSSNPEPRGSGFLLYKQYSSEKELRIAWIRSYLSK